MEILPASVLGPALGTGGEGDEDGGVAGGGGERRRAELSARDGEVDGVGVGGPAVIRGEERVVARREREHGIGEGGGETEAGERGADAAAEGAAGLVAAHNKTGEGEACAGADVGAGGEIYEAVAHGIGCIDFHEGGAGAAGGVGERRGVGGSSECELERGVGAAGGQREGTEAGEETRRRGGVPAIVASERELRGEARRLVERDGAELSSEDLVVGGPALSFVGPESGPPRGGQWEEIGRVDGGDSAGLSGYRRGALRSTNARRSSS